MVNTRSEIIFLEGTADPDSFVRKEIKRVYSEQNLIVKPSYVSLSDVKNDRKKDYPAARVRIAKIFLNAQEQEIVKKKFYRVSSWTVYYYHVDYEENYVYDWSHPGKYPGKIELYVEESVIDHHFLVGYSTDYKTKIIIPHHIVTGKNTTGGNGDE